MEKRRQAAALHINGSDSSNKLSEIASALRMRWREGNRFGLMVQIN